LLSPSHPHPTSTIPTTKEGIILLSCPFRGSDLYLESISSHIASSQNAYFLSIKNDDVFPRFSGQKVVSSPPVKAGTSGDSADQNGRLRRANRRIQGAFGPAISISMHGGVPMMGTGGGAQGGEEDDGGDDVVGGIPYPWFKPYSHGPQHQPLSLITHRTRTQDPIPEHQSLLSTYLDDFFQNVSETLSTLPSQKPLIIFWTDFLSLTLSPQLQTSETLATISGALAKFRARHAGVPILLVAPSTPTFPFTTTTAKPKTGIEDLLSQMRGEEDDGGKPHDNEENFEGGAVVLGGMPRKKKEIRFETPLDGFMGISSVAVVPPLDGVAAKEWKEMVGRDLRTIVRRENLRDLWVVGRAAGVEVDVGQVERGLEEEDGEGRGGGSVEERFWTPSEVERVLVLAFGSARRKGEGEQSSLSSSSSEDTLSTPQPTPTPTTRDVLHAIKTFTHSHLTTLQTRHGLSHASLFPNPSTLSTLTKHERRLLHHCLISPSTLQHSSFSSIGGLARVKRTIDEVIRLPLLKPELFRKGVLKSSTTGILLFGPPGTGKTMLARAVAGESGARFLNVGMGNIQSMWVGENEKVGVKSCCFSGVRVGCVCAL
ncbi:hypothetical protein HDV00_000601, partial [Rhizophlyctis rosea]